MLAEIGHFVKQVQDYTAILNMDRVIARRRSSVVAISGFSEKIASQRTLAMTYLELLRIINQQIQGMPGF